MPSKDSTLDRVSRVLALIETGVPIFVIDAALNRASDEQDFGQLIGLVEDLCEFGVDMGNAKGSA